MISDKIMEEEQKLEKACQQAEEECMKEFLKDPSSEATKGLEEKFIEALKEWKHYHWKHANELYAKTEK